MSSSNPIENKMSKAPLAFKSIDSTLGLLKRIRRNLTFCGSLKILVINLSKISLASWKVLGSLSVNFLTIDGKNIKFGFIATKIAQISYLCLYQFQYNFVPRMKMPRLHFALYLVVHLGIYIHHLKL